jgi:hypothetical protein
MNNEGDIFIFEEYENCNSYKIKHENTNKYMYMDDYGIMSLEW